VALAGEWLDVSRETIGLNRSDNFWIDIDKFHNLIAQCQTHGHRPSEVCPSCLSPLAQAVELYRGDFLAGFSLSGSLNFDDWQFFKAQELRLDLSGAMERLVRYQSAQGEFDSAIRYALRWLSLDRLNEPAHYQLMRLYALSGQRAAALRQYEECARTLERELRESPQEATVHLYKAIKENRFPTPPVRGRLGPSEGVKEDKARPSSDTPPAIFEEESRIATVLSVEMTGPVTAMGEGQLGDGASTINRFLKSVEGVLTRYGGEIDRLLGEGVLVVFGRDRTHETDPELAIRAAMEILKEAEKLGLSATGGVDTGGVYFGRIGSGGGEKFAAMGSVVSLAMRLAEGAEAGRILVGESTYRHTRRAFEFKSLPAKVKGMSEAVTAYRVERLLPEPKKARGIEGLRAELIGRDEEFGRLKSALSEVLRGRGGMVSIIGEAGVGKSRLVDELENMVGSMQKAVGSESEFQSLWGPLFAGHVIASADRQPLTACWLEGRCLEMGKAASYWPFIDIFHAYFGWGPEDDDHQRSKIITSSLREMVSPGDLSQERSTEIGSFLGNLLSIQLGGDLDERLKNASPEQIKNQTFMAVRDFFTALAKRGPLILVFEDLHWADSLSIDLISLLIEALRFAPMLLICVFRPEKEHRCYHLGTIASQKCPELYTELILRELTPKESRRLVESLLRIENLSPSVKELDFGEISGESLLRGGGGEIADRFRCSVSGGRLLAGREGDRKRSRAGERPERYPEPCGPSG
jgi:class 3 adenylate cyclase